MCVAADRGGSACPVDRWGPQLVAQVHLQARTGMEKAASKLACEIG